MVNFRHNTRRMTLKEQQERRKDIEFREGLAISGCVPMDEYEEQLLEAIDADSVDLTTIGFGEDQAVENMPVIKWNENLKSWLAIRESLIESVEAQGQCLAPWEIWKNLPANRKVGKLLWGNQGAIGSCSSFGFAHAFMSTMLINIGLGSPQTFYSINPIGLFYASKGNLRGGQAVSTIADFGNRIGHFPEELIGQNTQKVPSNFREAETKVSSWQSCIAFIPGKGDELAENCMKCIRAGVGVAFGNSNAVSGSNINKDGLSEAIVSGRWAHMTAWVYHRKVNGSPYYKFINSWGDDRYKDCGDGSPTCGCYMTPKLVEAMCQTIPSYGSPIACIASESFWVKDRSFVNEIKVPFPANWRR